MKLSPQVKFAREYAIKKHGNQKYGDKPYVFHLDAVHSIVLEMGLDEDYQIAAYLHDVLEDTITSKEELADFFNLHIIEMVYAVSGVGVNRTERHIDMKKKLELYPLAINLKMADRLANLRSSKINRPSLFLTYKKEHDCLFELFSQGSITLLNAMEDVLEIPQTQQLKSMKI